MAAPHAEEQAKAHTVGEDFLEITAPDSFTNHRVCKTGPDFWPFTPETNAERVFIVNCEKHCRSGIRQLLTSEPQDFSYAARITRFFQADNGEWDEVPAYLLWNPGDFVVCVQTPSAVYILDQLGLAEQSYPLEEPLRLRAVKHLTKSGRNFYELEVHI